MAFVYDRVVCPLLARKNILNHYCGDNSKRPSNLQSINLFLHKFHPKLFLVWTVTGNYYYSKMTYTHSCSLFIYPHSPPPPSRFLLSLSLSTLVCLSKIEVKPISHYVIKLSGGSSWNYFFISILQNAFLSLSFIRFGLVYVLLLRSRLWKNFCITNNQCGISVNNFLSL